MKFESQYLIKWGMPGWFLMLWVLFIQTQSEKVEFIQFDILRSFSGAFTLTLVGIILGYILYQVYFVFTWIIPDVTYKYLDKVIKELESKGISLPEDKDDKYFQIEYLWHSNVKELDEHKMNYYSQRYAYLLSRKHEIGVFTLSLLLCSLFAFWINIYEFFNLILVISYVVCQLFALAAIYVYYYYSSNVEYIFAKFMNEIVPPANEQTKPVTARSISTTIRINKNKAASRR